MIFRAPPPTLDVLDNLLGRKPGDYDATVAALALDASSLIASLEPWWIRGCGYRWGAEDVMGCPDYHGWRLLCTMGLVDGLPVAVRRQLWRASIPASVWAAFAIIRSRGKLDHYSAGDVQTAGLFALPLDTARAAGFNPWSVYDALRFVRVSVEGRVAAWQAHEGPAPNCRRLEDYVYASLFQELVGSACATYVFGLLDSRGVDRDTVPDLLRYGRVDASSGAFAGVSKDDATALAYAVRDALQASELIEGFDYGWRIGLVVGASGVQQLGLLRSVPREGSWLSPFPDEGASDPAAAVVTDLVRSVDATTEATLAVPPRLDPWEVPEEEGGVPFDQIAGDAWQTFSFADYGHYPTRHAVLSTLVPTYLDAVGAGEEPAPYPRPSLPPVVDESRPPPRQARSSSWKTWLAVGAVAAATVTAIGAAVWWSRRRTRGGDRGSTLWLR